MANPSSLLSRVLARGEAFASHVKQDGWVNLLTGLGSKLRDKTKSTRFMRDANLTVDECEALFHGDDLAATIVSSVPDDACREGINVQRCVEDLDGALDLPEPPDLEDQPTGQDPAYAGTDTGVRQDRGPYRTRQDDATSPDAADVMAQTQVLENRLRELRAVQMTHDGMVWGRCMGGAAIVLLTEGTGQPWEPMDDDLVTRIVTLTVVDRGDLHPASWYADPLLPKYGEVETWYLMVMSPQGVMVQSQVRIHETRLIMFGGAMTSRREKIRNQGWDHSVLQRLMNILSSTNTAWDSVMTMMADFSQAVFKINGLIDAIAEDDQEKIQKRMAVTDMVRSVARAIVLDAEDEDFKVVERGTITGIGDLLDKVFLRLAAAARIPVFRLMGQSPAGLNATGDVDLRWWYDTIRYAQRSEIKPRYERIVQLVARELFPGEDPTVWEATFPSLWQMTPTEEADLRAKIATTDAAYVNMGSALPEEVTLTRFTRGAYTSGAGLGPLVVDLAARKRMLAAELVKLEAKAVQPDPVPPGPGALPPNAGQDPKPAGQNDPTPPPAPPAGE